MDILSIAILVFVVLEALNILVLYFAPDSRKGNGVGVFKAYEESKDHPEVRALIGYLINWVAGTKIIFVVLLIVILVTGTTTTRVFAVVALLVSILSFYWRLYPALRRMDARGAISPRGYARTLGIMIGCFVGGFVAALAVHLLTGGGA
jgi:hypothetical protein